MKNQDEPAREGDGDGPRLGVRVRADCGNTHAPVYCRRALAFGGTDTGPTPYDLLLAALGS